MIVVAIIGMLSAILVPNIIRSRKTTSKNSCINNLRIIADAVQELKLESPADPIDEAHIEPYLGRKRPDGNMPVCPLGGIYGNFDTIPTCDKQELLYEHTLRP